MAEYPRLLHTVLDTTTPRQLAEFYRELLGLQYRPGDEPPAGRADGGGGGEGADGATVARVPAVATIRTGSCSSTPRGRASSRSSSSTS